MSVRRVFKNHKNNNPKNRYTITENALAQAVISYSKKSGNNTWDCVTADVRWYTAAVSSEYTRLCITAFFDGTIKGDQTQAAKTITVSNTSSNAKGKMNVTLSGTNKNSFTLSKASINSISTGRTDSFTVKPNNNLKEGTCTATVTMSNNNISEQFEVHFTVNKVC